MSTSNKINIIHEFGVFSKSKKLNHNFLFNLCLSESLLVLNIKPYF